MFKPDRAFQPEVCGSCGDNRRIGKGKKKRTLVYVSEPSKKLRRKFALEVLQDTIGSTLAHAARERGHGTHVLLLLVGERGGAVGWSLESLSS